MNCSKMGSMGVGPDRNQDATVYVGDLDEKVTEELLWEFFLQCGPIVSVHIPRDKVLDHVCLNPSGTHHF